MTPEKEARNNRELIRDVITDNFFQKHYVKVTISVLMMCLIGVVTMTVYVMNVISAVSTIKEKTEKQETRIEKVETKTAVYDVTIAKIDTKLENIETTLNEINRTLRTKQ